MTLLHRFLILSRYVLAKINSFWTFPLSLVCADLLLIGIVIALAGAYWIERAFPFPALATMAALTVVCHGVTATYAQRFRLGLLVRIAAGNLLAIGVYALLRGQLSDVVGRVTFATLIMGFAPLQAALHLYWRRDGRTSAETREPWRVILLAAAALWLHRPLLTNGSVGAGDAYWYSIMVADFVTQWREGIFPVFAGQSEFAFNGTISPLRLAPYLQHLAGVVDLITLRTLPFFGLLNASLVLSFLGGGMACYLCLRRIEPRAPWLAFLLSLIYLTCPGMLALAYAGDLFMSITAVPYLPLLLYGAWRTLTKGDRKAVIALVAPAAALWYCHPPIALWGTIIAAVTQVIRLARDGLKRQTWMDWLVGALVFGILTLAAFVSVLTLNLPSHPVDVSALVASLTQAYPAALAPVSAAANLLSDYQLGWALWGVLLAGIVGLAFVRPRLPSLGLLAAAGVLLVFLLPGPHLAPLWSAMPKAIPDITYLWPMQRFYVLLAGLSVFLAFSTVAPLALRYRGIGIVLMALTATGAGWSAWEAGKFHAHAALTTAQPSATRLQHQSQNRTLTRYSFNTFREIPPYFSHGFIDPLKPNRLLAADTLQELASNDRTLGNDPHFGTVRAEGMLSITRPDPAAPTLVLTPLIKLEPHRRYVLTLDFKYPQFEGALVFRGVTLTRLYWMPDSGYGTTPVTPSVAFGALPGRSRNITLWTGLEVPEEVMLQFFFNGESPAPEATEFAHYTLKEFDPSLLPIAIESWAPYRARLQAPVASYLETPRVYLEGYRARVNGRKTAVTRSPNALVMIAVPPGNNLVELAYVGPMRLRVAYFVSLAGWLGLFLWQWRGRRATAFPDQARFQR